MDLIVDEHPQSEEEVQPKRVFSIPLAIPSSILLRADEEFNRLLRQSLCGEKFPRESRNRHQIQSSSAHFRSIQFHG
jgi:hypothetical protein